MQTFVDLRPVFLPSPPQDVHDINSDEYGALGRRPVENDVTRTLDAVAAVPHEPLGDESDGVCALLKFEPPPRQVLVGREFGHAAEGGIPVAEEAA